MSALSHNTAPRAQGSAPAAIRKRLLLPAPFAPARRSTPPVPRSAEKFWKSKRLPRTHAISAKRRVEEKSRFDDDILWPILMSVNAPLSDISTRIYPQAGDLRPTIEHSAPSYKILGKLGYSQKRQSHGGVLPPIHTQGSFQRDHHRT